MSSLDQYQASQPYRVSIGSPHIMLLRLSDLIAECLGRAAEARERADAADEAAPRDLDLATTIARAAAIMISPQLAEQ